MNNDESNTDKGKLKSFGLLLSIIIPSLFGLFFPIIQGRSFPFWPWVIAGIVLLLALVLPISLKYIYILFMKIGSVLGWVNTRIILALIFFTLFFFVALIMKIIKKDPMSRVINKNTISYRVDSIKQSRKHFERPY